MSEASEVGSLIERDLVSEELTGNKTLDSQDCGKKFKVLSDCTITLPATSLGLFYIIENGQLKDGRVEITVNPNAADQIVGPDITAADDKDLINTKATSRRGDRVALFGDGTNGWFVTNMVGAWDREA